MQFDRPIVITTGASRKATVWKPETLLWSELCQRLGSFHRSTETLAQYKEMPKSKQDELKDVGGFVAGTFKGERRKACDTRSRQYPRGTDGKHPAKAGIARRGLLRVLDQKAFARCTASACAAAVEQDGYSGRV